MTGDIIHSRTMETGIIMRIINILAAAATPMRLLAVAVLCAMVRYGVMPYLGAQAMNTPGAGPLDLMFAYSPAQAFAALAAFSDAGRAAYRLFLLTADLAYPITYTLVLAWSIALFSRTTRWENARWLLLAPLFLFGFDMAENMGIVALLGVYPAQPIWLALITSLCTTLKWIFAGSSIVIVLALLVVRVAGHIRARAE